VANAVGALAGAYLSATLPLPVASAAAFVRCAAADVAAPATRVVRGEELWFMVDGP
jgi:hypothetical protein